MSRDAVIRALAVMLRDSHHVEDLKPEARDLRRELVVGARAEHDALVARCLAAEQRAEAAETERDRMRPVVEAALMWSKWNPKHGLLAAIAAYRAGQPATSEAELREKL